MATPSTRMPDPTPQEIQQRCREIQQTWDADTRWVRRYDQNLKDRDAFVWRPPTVAELDVYGSRRGGDSVWIDGK